MPRPLSLCLVKCTQPGRFQQHLPSESDLTVALGLIPASDMLSAQLLPPGQSKAVGVGRLLKQLDVQPAEMMAVGDSESDIEILKMAGTCCGFRVLGASSWCGSRAGQLHAADLSLSLQLHDSWPSCMPCC